MRNARMTTRLAPSTIRLLTAACMTLVIGCLDMRIIHVEKPASDAGDAGPPSDAALDATTPDGPAVCETCLRAPSQATYGCGDEMAACATDPVCAGTIECAIAKGCFQLNGQGPIIDCGTPCAREAGLDINSPGAALIFAMVTCGQEKCGPICRGEVGGPSADASVK